MLFDAGAGRALTQSLSSVLTNTLTFSLAQVVARSIVYFFHTHTAGCLQMLSRTLPMAISKEAVAALIPAATETVLSCEMGDCSICQPFVCPLGRLID